MTGGPSSGHEVFPGLYVLFSAAGSGENQSGSARGGHSRDMLLRVRPGAAHRTCCPRTQPRRGRGMSSPDQRCGLRACTRQKCPARLEMPWVSSHPSGVGGGAERRRHQWLRRGNHDIHLCRFVRFASGISHHQTIPRLYRTRNHSCIGLQSGKRRWRGADDGVGASGQAAAWARTRVQAARRARWPRWRRFLWCQLCRRA